MIWYLVWTIFSTFGIFPGAGGWVVWIKSKANISQNWSWSFLVELGKMFVFNYRLSSSQCSNLVNFYARNFKKRAVFEIIIEVVEMREKHNTEFKVAMSPNSCTTPDSPEFDTDFFNCNMIHIFNRFENTCFCIICAY